MHNFTAEVRNGSYMFQLQSSHHQRYTDPPGWGLVRWTSTSSPAKKTHALKNLDKGFEKQMVYPINDMKLEKG